jgi:hypothetical protein
MEQAGSLLDRAVCALAAGDRATARAQVEASLATNRTRLGQALAIFLDDAAPRIAGRREEHAFFSSALVGAKADPLDAWPGG